MVYPIIFLIFFIGIFFRPLNYIYEQRYKFLSRGYNQQYASLRSAYYSSQYVQKKNPVIIPDETFEAFAGGFFLKGGNPILITHDHPPLGRYIVSLSILLFDNANTLIIPLLALSVFGIFLITKTIINNAILSLIPIGIFVNEPLFIGKIMYTPLPESIQLPFIIFSLYFFIMGILNKRYMPWFISTSIMLGFVISTRFFITGSLLIISMIFYFLMKKSFNRKFISFLFTLPLAIIILFLAYTKTILDGYSLRQILGVQKYILFYHKSKFILPFSFWDLILFNRWHTWWGERKIIQDTQWILVWPIVTFLTACSFFVLRFKKTYFTEPEKIIFLWIIFYSIVMSSGYTSTRYFLPLLPFLYILAFSFLVKLYKAIQIK